MDYIQDNLKMLKHLRETSPHRDNTDEIQRQPRLSPEDPDALVQQDSSLWHTKTNPRWKIGNLFDPTTMERQEGSGHVPPAPVDE
jgi:hypothetical protein